jgi:hypothetical protein
VRCAARAPALARFGDATVFEGPHEPAPLGPCGGLFFVKERASLHQGEEERLPELFAGVPPGPDLIELIEVPHGVLVGLVQLLDHLGLAPHLKEPDGLGEKPSELVGIFTSRNDTLTKPFHVF